MPNSTPFYCSSDLIVDKAPSPGPPIRAQDSAGVPWDHKLQPGQSEGLHSVLLYTFPPSLRSLWGTLFGFQVLTRIRVNWGALKKDAGCSIAEGPVYHVAVSCNPADVSHTAEDVPWPVVKHKLHKQERLSGACHPMFPHVTKSVL